MSAKGIGALRTVLKEHEASLTVQLKQDAEYWADAAHTAAEEFETTAEELETANAIIQSLFNIVSELEEANQHLQLHIRTLGSRCNICNRLFSDTDSPAFVHMHP